MVVRLKTLATGIYLALVLALGIARLGPHLTVRFSPPAIEDIAPTVAVTGAVRAPGVYTLEPGARVADALAAAGGPAGNADPEALDLALPVADGETLRVPAKGKAVPRALGAPRTAVNVNTADLSALESVPGIGPVLARRIVAHRPYRSLDELLRVPGIGPKSLERLRPYLIP